MKKMPGFDEYQADLEKKELEQRKAKEKQEAETKKKEEHIKYKLAQKQLDEKLNIISQNDKSLMQKSRLASFAKAFFVSNILGFLVGSVTFLSNDGRDSTDYPYGHEPLFTSHEIYGDMTYGQAIKNAYLLDDWRHGKGGVFQGYCGILSVLISIGAGIFMADATGSNNKEKTEKAKKILKELELLKYYGIGVPELIKNLTPSIKKMLESLSAMDRRYFDNLAAGGLDKANYETCVAIVEGYLNSHPKEYNKVIEIIDEATLPAEIIKKYGKDKTISFAAAQKLQTER